MNVIAYLDPASGSMIAATAAAGIAGFRVAAKSIWHRRPRLRKDDGSEVATTESASADGGDGLTTPAATADHD